MLTSAQSSTLGSPARPASRSPAIDAARTREALERACARIAPAWPLDRLIATNPFWGWTEGSVSEAADALAALSGARLTQPRAVYRSALETGRLTTAHLTEAIADLDAPLSVDDATRALGRARRRAVPAPRQQMVDVADRDRDLVHEMSWRPFVRDHLSAYCATFFDRGQASAPRPASGRGSGLQDSLPASLYDAWRAAALVDRTPSMLMGMHAFREHVARLPATPAALLHEAIAELSLAEAEIEPYLTSLLLDINGWASYAAYLRWCEALHHDDPRHADGHFEPLAELALVRLAWELLLYRAGDHATKARWGEAMASWHAVQPACTRALAVDHVAQRALELGHHASTAATLVRGARADQTPAERGAPARVQAVFCIDVRSERMRRALEATSSGVQTLGFAGFFGLPAAWADPHHDGELRPQLPGLLGPRVVIRETGLSADALGRVRRRRSFDRILGAVQTGAASMFQYVEAFGLMYAGAAAVKSVAPRTEPLAPTSTRPRVVEHGDGRALSDDERADLAAGILRGMSLTRGFASVVLLVGHASQTTNNPHAAGLDCGACCGQSGEVNARAVAALLNDPEVRSGLQARGIDVPASTTFVAGLHNTTTDRVRLFVDDIDTPPHDAEALGLAESWLASAAERTRAERARALDVVVTPDAPLERAIASRATSWSQVRPEWGLAGNTSLIVAPRARSSHADLDGRSFLHDYRWEEDPDGAVLEGIMAGPLVVAHWINAQYNASTNDNERYGAGNKVLHNVVGGSLGVLEGNGGDLRIGLPWQSLHDGRELVHEPIALGVFIEAPRDRLEGILAGQPTVRALAEGGWIHLYQLDPSSPEVWRRGPGGWRPVTMATNAEEASDRQG